MGHSGMGFGGGRQGTEESETVFLYAVRCEVKNGWMGEGERTG